jgi:hypothetical protein
MKCVTMLCAQSILIDKQTNRATIIQVLEEVGCVVFPTVTPLGIYARLQREKDEPKDVKLMLKISTAKTVLISYPFTVNFYETTYDASVNFNLEQLLISEPGVISVSFEYEGKIIGSYDIFFKDAKEVNLQATGFGTA